MNPNFIDFLAARVHKQYCTRYFQVTGNEFRTEGDYEKLDEEEKEIDRDSVKAVLHGLVDYLTR